MPFRPTWLALAAVSMLSLLSACDQLAPVADKPLSEQEKSALSMADNMKRNGNYDGAASIYRELVTKDFSSAAAYIGLSSIYRTSGRGEEAVALMRQAEKKNPADQAVLLELGYALIAANQPEEAVSVFDKLTAINHGSASAYNGKAVAFDHAGNHTAAQEIYQKALKLSPTSTTIQNNLALSMILNDQVDTAISLLEPISHKSNAPAAVRHNLALAYGVKGDAARARTINLKDMTPTQADENQKFYEYYSQMLKKQKIDAVAHNMNVDLNDPADDDTQPVTLSTKIPEPKVNAEPKAKPEPAAKADKKPEKAAAPVKEAKPAKSPVKAPPEKTVEAPPPAAAQEPAPEPKKEPEDKGGKFMGYDSVPVYPAARGH